MKIVLVSYEYWPPDFGGELLASIERLEALSQRGHQVTVLTSGRSDYPTRQIVNNLFIIFRSPVIGEWKIQRLLRRIVYFLWVCYHLINKKYDVIHLGSLPGLDRLSSALCVWLFALFARLKGERVFMVHSLADFEDSTVETKGVIGFSWRICINAVDKMVAVSPALYEGLKVFGTEKIHLLTYGVHDDIFHPLEPDQRNQERIAHGLREQDVVFAFLGSVGKRKGFDLLAQAFAVLAENHPNWRLWVIGPYTHQQSQNINAEEVRQVTLPLENLGGCVHYWGRVDDRIYLAQLLALSDVFVFPSRKEGMGIAPVEAMSTGIPVIIALIPGVTDLANKDQITGFYVPVGDTKELENKMRRLGEQPELRRQMGFQARQRVIHQFGWEQHITSWEQVYSLKKRNT